MKLSLVAACLVAGVALTSAFVHRLPFQDEDDQADFECEPVGDYYVPHPDCTRYYECSNGVLFTKKCAGTLYWSQELKECRYPHEVPECIGGTRPPVDPTNPPPTTQAPVTTPTPEVTTEAPEVTTEAPEVTTGAPEVTTEAPEVTTADPVTTGVPEVSTTEQELTTRDPSNPCVEDGIYALPDSTDCSAYTQCVNGVAIPSSCHPGLLFDPSIGKCNKEELVDCAVSTTPVFTTTQEPQITEAPLCRPGEIHKVPVPDSCSLYILCADGTPIIQECAEGLSFDPVKLNCVRAEESTCVEPTTTFAPEITSTEAEPTTSEPEVSTTSRPPVRCEYDGVYNIPAEDTDCTAFYICINRIPYYQTCAEGTLFDPETSKCVREETFQCFGTTVQPATSSPTEPSTTEAPATEAPTTEAQTTEAPVTEAPTTPAPPPTTPGNELECSADGFYPHPSSCSLFFKCVNGDVSGVYDCGTGYWFDAASQTCTSPENSDCKLNP